MLLFPLIVSGCASQTEGSLQAFCQGTSPLVNAHVDALIANGDTLVYSAGEVLVTGDQLITVYDKACKQ